MIQGTFGERGQLFFEIDLITTDRLYLPVDAMLDTGFTEFMAINKQDLNGLAWSYLGKEPLQTAQGESVFERYSGKVLIDGREYEIPVFAGEEIREILLGSQWLKIMPLVVNYQASLLTLG